MKHVLSTVLLLVASFAVAAQGAESVADVRGTRAKQLTLERLYALPRLIGTAPRSFAWSPDGRRLAFLWNDEGRNFRDVWILDIGKTAPVRFTALPQAVVDPQVTDPVTRREREVAIEQDEGIGELAWHPNGRQMFVSLRGTTHLLAVRKPLQALKPAAPSTLFAVSADGTRLAYVAAGELWMQPLAAARAGANVVASGPASRLLARTSDATTVTRIAWAPDGEHIAIVETDRSKVPLRNIPDYLTEEARMHGIARAYPGEPAESRRIGIVDIGTAQTRWPSLGGHSEDLVFTMAWSPDGTQLLIDTSDLYVKHRRLMLVDAEGGDAKTWVEERDANNVSAQWWADWAPDGAGIYFTSDRDEDYHVYYRKREGGNSERITHGAWAVEGVQIVAAANALFVTGNLGAAEQRHLFRIPLGGGEPLRITRSAGTHLASVSPDGRFAAGEFSSDRVPPDLFLTRIGAAGADSIEVQVTHSPLEEFANYDWAPTRYVEFPSHVDGVTLHGRLTLPPDFDPKRGHYPAIVGSIYSNSVRNRWGGRVAHPTWGLDHYLAQQGFVLLNIDVAGSSGHGKAFRQRIRLDYGGIDVADIESGARHLAATGFVDAQRLGIWGSSYGGLLTAQTLFTRPGLFKAGVAGAPATNVWHALTGEMRVMGRPQDNPEAYARASAFTRADGLRDHLMIIHGMRDSVVLFRDSVSLTHKLMLLGRDVELVALPDAGHGWDDEGLYQTIYAFRKLVGHFERHLGRGPR